MSQTHIFYISCRNGLTMIIMWMPVWTASIYIFVVIMFSIGFYSCKGYPVSLELDQGSAFTHLSPCFHPSSSLFLYLSLTFKSVHSPYKHCKSPVPPLQARQVTKRVMLVALQVALPMGDLVALITFLLQAVKEKGIKRDCFSFFF